MIRAWLPTALCLALACGGNSAPAPADQAPPPAPAATEPKDDPAALLAAAEAYVRENSTVDLAFHLEVHAIEGDHALLLVVPERSDLEPALALMKRDAGTWRGLDLGAGLDCDTLLEHGAPETLCDKL
jgi:hypothetical protein